MQIFMDGFFKYENIIKIQDLGIFICGIIFGGILSTLLIASFISKIETFDKKDRKVRIVRVSHENKVVYSAHFGTLWETFEDLILFSFAPFFTRRSFTYKDKKRTKRFIVVLSIICIFILLFTLMSVFKVKYPPDYEPQIEFLSGN